MRLALRMEHSSKIRSSFSMCSAMPALRCGVQLTHKGQIKELSENLFALSQLISLERPVSWVPSSVGGFDPSNVYVIRASDEAVVIDTGLRAHRDLMVDQLKAVIPQGARIAVVLTREEPDCLGGLDELVKHFRVNAIYCNSTIHPLAFFGPFADLYP